MVQFYTNMAQYETFADALKTAYLIGVADELRLQKARTRQDVKKLAGKVSLRNGDIDALLAAYRHGIWMVESNRLELAGTIQKRIVITLAEYVADKWYDRKECTVIYLAADGENTEVRFLDNLFSKGKGCRLSLKDKSEVYLTWKQRLEVHYLDVSTTKKVIREKTNS